MLKLIGRRQKTLMSQKFNSMLLGGTLTMMIVSVLLMSDSVIAGSVINSAAVEGITLVTPLYSLSAFFGSVVSLGVPILYSTEMGRFQKREADRVFGVGLLTSLGVSMALFAFTCLFGDAMIASYNPTAAVLEYARGYLGWMRFTILLLPMNMLLAAVVFNDGDETVSTIANAVQGVGNLAASLWLSRIYGIRGIAMASFLFNLVSMMILSTHFLRKNNSLRLNFCFSWDILKRIIRYSIIDASSYLFLAAFSAGMSLFVSWRFGQQYLILASVLMLCRELQMVFDGIGEAISPILSVYLGEDCYAGVRAIYALARRTSILEGTVVTLLLILLAPLVPAVLHISNPDLASAAVLCLRSVALGSCPVCQLYLSTSYYLLIDKIGLGLMICALRDVLVTTPLAVLLGSLFGLYGFFTALALAPSLAWLGSALFLRTRYKGDAPLLLGERERGKVSLLYNLAVEPEDVIRARDAIGDELRQRGYDNRTITRVALLFEELFMLLHEKNAGRAVQGECALLLEGDRIRLIARDTGIKFNLSDSDMEVSSLRSYVVSRVAETISTDKRHLVTMSFNRNVFEISARPV